MALRGFGFTLKADSGEAGDWKAQEKDEWYEDLHRHSSWTALWGADGTGDLLKLGNLEHLVKKLAKEQVLLCVADGGFSDDAIPQNLLELYFYRLFLAELLTAVSCLSPGGKFVCKLYSSFSDATASLLFLTTRLFDSVEIVKPISSKATGPERYLVAAGFLDNAESSAIQAALSRAHLAGRGASPLVTPLLTPLLLRETLAQDQKFSASAKAMVSTLCERQTLALYAVVDRADFLEDMAMESAVCIDPWSRRPPSPKFHESLPTPARAGAWKGKGKGKGGWRQRQ
jgi:cap1 methyltransferase